MTELELLIEARDILAERHIRHQTRDGKGGYCAMGAVLKSSGWYDHGENWLGRRDDEIACTQALQALADAVQALYPHQRMINAIDVNDNYGKAAILKVFDTAIAKLQFEQPVPVPADWKVKETVNV